MSRITVFEDGVLKLDSGAVIPNPNPPLTPTPPPPPTPPPTPNPATCGPGEVFGGGDKVWTPFITTTPFPPLHGVTGSGDLGVAVRFVADAVNHPTGINLKIVDVRNPTVRKDIVISACPHDFVGSIVNCKASGVGSAGAMYLRFGPAHPNTQSYDCPLTPGGVYYINFRSRVTPRIGVASQFAFTDRTD